jgi:FecR protein
VTRVRLALAVALGYSLAGTAVAQHVISAKSGLIHYIEGEVYLGDKELKPKPGEYPEVKVGEHLRTSPEGRAEVLLTPGVFLRLAEDSEIAMLANALTNTRIDVVKGSVLVEAGEISKDQSIQLTAGGTTLEVHKRGLFRIDAGPPARVRTYDGEIRVSDDAEPLRVKSGREVLVTSVPTLDKFEKDDTDAFHRWAGRRSGYLSVANVTSAHSMLQNGIPWHTGGWYFNPYFGMFTYIPLRGRYVNPWGQVYYSPAHFYRPQPSMNMDPFAGGMRMPRAASGSSGMSSGSRGGYQAPAASSPSMAPSSGGARSAGSGSSRGGRSGGR